MIPFKKGENKQLSKNFNSSEFQCPCSKCTDQFIDQKLIDKLQQVRDTYGKALKVNSGYRCPEHNAAVGGKIGSAHMSGLAADIAPVLMTLDELDDVYEICYNVFDNIGDGRNKKFVHVDVREPKKTGKRLWIY
jgi:uncharacterized protein YcbK (DUF882 family)